MKLENDLKERKKTKTKSIELEITNLNVQTFNSDTVDTKGHQNETNENNHKLSLPKYF